MILFSVYDHDVLTYNDFGGEALFPVRDAAGIQKGKAGNFHGLKPVELPLMFQENNGKCTFNSVKILEFLSYSIFMRIFFFLTILETLDFFKQFLNFFRAEIS